MVWSVGWPLLRAEGFFCNLDILYGGLGIGKLQFLIKKKYNFFFSCSFFQFLVIKALDPYWIRIRIGLQPQPLDPDPDPEKWIRLRNTAISLNPPSIRSFSSFASHRFPFILHCTFWFLLWFLSLLTSSSFVYCTLIKKNIKFSSYIRKFRSSCKVIYEEGLPNTYEEMRKYSRRPLVIYDFATAPFWFPYIGGKFYFIFLSVYRPGAWRERFSLVINFTL